MRTTRDFSKEPLDDIVGADRLPVFFWIGIKGQADLHIALQACHGGRIDCSILLNQRGHGLISSLPIFLLEQGFHFRFELFLLLGRDITEDVIQLVNHTALTSRIWDLRGDGGEHRLGAITDPQVNRFDAPLLQVFRASSFPACSFSRLPPLNASTSLSPVSAMPTTARMGILQPSPL